MSGQVVCPICILMPFPGECDNAHDLNYLTGKNSFQRKSLHHLGDIQNPYEQAISILGRTLSTFDEDNLIPCFGFGDGNIPTSHSIIYTCLIII